MTHLEWTNEIDSMRDALRALNCILLETVRLEESALSEAKIVKFKLDAGDLSRAETVDYLKQASIDLMVNRRSQNETN